MRIRTKILGLIGGASLLSLVVGGIGVQGMVTMRQGLADEQAASQRALYSERLNRLVTTVVMDSRGVYAADTTAEAKPFAAGILVTLGQIDELLAAWRPMLPAFQSGQFDTVATGARQFAEIRREVARLGVEDSPKAADTLGNNEANRANRKAFQAAIDVLTKSSQNEAATTEATVDARSQQALTWLLGVAGAGVVTALLLGGLIALRGIARPLQRVSGAIAALAAGKHDVALGRPGRDEIGEIWRSMGVFATTMQEAERLRAEQAEAEEARAAERRATMLDIAGQFENSVGGIVASVSAAATQLQASARTMSEAVGQTNDQAVAVAAASEQASANVQTVASAAEELSSSVGEIGRQVSESGRIANKAVEDAAATAANIRALAEASQRIGQVVELISSVADQTNLLALNATIEAARAGEAGRGFAVVAAEVKQLADQTGKATSDIAAQIGAIQASTERSMAAVQGIGRTIESMDAITTGIEAAVVQQGSATGEIAASIGQVSQGTAEVAQAIASVTQAAAESSAAAAQVFDLSSDLAAQAVSLRTEMSRMLETVRAA